MPFTANEKQRIRYHLGYPSMTSAASVAYGVPMMNQTNFLVETALNNILEAALDQVRQQVSVMDSIEVKLISAQDRLAATKLEELTLRGDETDQLEAEYRRWGYRLADILGVPIYPLSMRYRASGGNAVTMIPIRRDI